MKPKTNIRKKDGAALVIALGFLALLTITIVAFTAQMRSERLAGRGFLVAAQNRHLLHAALSRALEDIEIELNGTNYPQFFAIGSVGDSADLLTDSINFSTVAAYIPGTNSPIHTDYLDVLATDARWWMMYASSNQPIGRVGYIILNTSGLLDANEVGGGSRNKGTSPREITLDPQLLDEFNTEDSAFELHSRAAPSTTTTNPASAFTHNRSGAWNRFESLRDVKTLNQLDGDDIIVSQPESFSTFSLYPSNVLERVALTTTVDSNDFITALINCGLDDAEADAVYEGYLDYVDADSIPTNLLSATTEAVPLINEIVVENFQFNQAALDATNITYTISGTLSVETWYPFGEDHPASPTLALYAAEPDDNLENETVAGNYSTDKSDYITITAVYPFGIGKSFVLDLTPNGDATVVNNFKTAHYTFDYKNLVTLDFPFSGGGAPLPSRIQLLLERIDVISTNEVVDRVELVAFESDYDTVGQSASHHASCIDPRLNHDFSDTTQWDMDASASLNAVNYISDWGEQDELTDKSDIRLYVRNRPMENAAELGLLSTGVPWRTVRLYGGIGDDALHPVLDYFHADEPLWNTSVRPGLINLNSPHTNVLATAFRDAPIRNTPGDTNSILTVSSELARQLGINMEALSATAKNQKYSSIGLTVSNNIPDWSDFTDAQKEAIVGNTYRLFGWRDTHFTILLAAQTLSGNEVQSTQQAVVHIWRDPETGMCACVFYGLADTLRSSLDGDSQTWGSILHAFMP